MELNIYFVLTFFMFYVGNINIIFLFGAQTWHATGCGFDSIFLFFRSGVEAKRGIELRHSTPDASTIPTERGKRSVLTLSYLSAYCATWDTA